MSSKNIRLKSPRDIERLSEGGQVLAQILDQVVKQANAGAVPQELDKLAHSLIVDAGCTPSFLNYGPKGHEPFPASLCVSVNHGLVHGMPNRTPLKDGDVVGLDLGLIYQQKYYLDHARTIIVGEDKNKAGRMIEVCEQALQIGIDHAQVGNKIGDISHAIQKYVEKSGFGVVRELVGHGVGFAVHEPPQVPNFGKKGKGDKIENGLVIAIEPMITRGDPVVQQAEDGWTIEIASGQLAAHSEHTIAVTEDGAKILTTVE